MEARDVRPIPTLTLPLSPSGDPHRKGRKFKILLATVFACASSAAFGQADYPSRPIRFLVGVVPGGAADTLARAIGQRYSAAFNQQVIVDNRPGANQTIATDITLAKGSYAFVCFMPDAKGQPHLMSGMLQEVKIA